MVAEKDVGAGYSDDFLRDSYRGLLKYLIESVDDSFSPAAQERRHDHHLRSLVEGGSFPEALAYLDAMVDFCERHEFKESWRYEGYRKRVVFLSKSSFAS